MKFEEVAIAQKLPRTFIFNIPSNFNIWYIDKTEKGNKTCEFDNLGNIKCDYSMIQIFIFLSLRLVVNICN